MGRLLIAFTISLLVPFFGWQAYNHFNPPNKETIDTSHLRQKLEAEQRKEMEEFWKKHGS